MASDRVFRPNEEQLELLKRWYAPDVTASVSQEKTNAFGLTAKQIADRQQVPVVEEVPQPEPESVQLTAQDLEEIRQSAHQEGYEAGFSKGKTEGVLAGHEEGYIQGVAQGQVEGHEQGIATGEAEIMAKLALLNQLVALLASPLDEQEQQIELALVDLALDVAKKVVHTEVTQNHQPIITAISEGVKVLGRNEPVTVRLHPQDIESVLSVWPQEQLDKRALELEADLTLTLGSCELESKLSSVTLDLNERIEQVFTDFYARPAPQLAVEAVESELEEDITATNLTDDPQGNQS